MKTRLAILALASALVLTGCSSPIPQTTQEESTDLSKFITGVSLSLTADDDHSLVSRILLTNIGDKPVKVSCSISAKDYKGIEVGSTPERSLVIPINPGQKDVFAAEIPIPGGNSKKATISAACRGELADSISYSVIVNEVTDCSFYADDEKVWYWGPCFSLPNLEPANLFNCHILALDSSGQPFDVMEYSGRVTMANNAGFHNFEFPKTSKENVEKIDNYSIKCWE